MNRPREDWPRLASYVVSARIAAGFRDRRALSAATGVTGRTLGKLETGHRVSADTLAAVELAVGWRPDSCRRVLAGDEPLMQPGTPGEDLSDEEMIASLSPAERQLVIEYRELLRGRLGHQDGQRAGGA